MKMINDEDEVNLQNKENWEYLKWEREQKNHILSMTNTNRKQEEWRKLFPQVEDHNLTEVY